MQRTIVNNQIALKHWEKSADLIDQFIDIPLNYRQSGHPGGSRSKVHMFLSLLLSGAMRWDIRDSDKRFGDKFVLGCGHTIPLVYATLALLNEAMRAKYEETGDSRYLIKDEEHRALYWEDLVGFRNRGGLSGHAEANGKSSFLKANTGPSGHGTPAAAGLAFSLKRSGAAGVKVFIMEGEGGLTPGATHETLNTAWGMALDNLHFLVDWNDFGIDGHKTSEVVYGEPKDWFAPHGWRVVGTEHGSEFASLTEKLDELTNDLDGRKSPSMLWFKTRKGRGYLKYDFASHGAPHKKNGVEYWTLRREFANKYGAQFVNMDGPYQEGSDEFRQNLKAVADVLRSDKALVTYLADRLVELGDSVPTHIEGYKLDRKGNPFHDRSLWDFASYPQGMWAKPGTKAANRAAMGKWGSYINHVGKTQYGRPIFLASSADLAGSTNLAGFGTGWEGDEGYGWYERVGTDEGVMAPTEITEFSNAGMLSSVASLNLSEKPQDEFDGFYGAVSTYASFSYLKYGPLRLFSQFCQDADHKVGKFLWVGAHSGPETADDSRTHFGIFSPGVTQLFPKGQILNLYPWEYNEVPVLLGAAFALDVPLIALHVTRPEITIPDRKASGIPSHFEAAKGAYVLREYTKGQDRGGTIFIQGTSAVASAVELLPLLEKEQVNVKLVCVTSPELFALQGKEYRDSVVTPADRADSTFITTHARRLMSEWVFNDLSEEYALSSDYDDRWRTGGSLEEVLDEAHMNPKWILEAIKRFASDRPKRLATLTLQLESALGAKE
ncbi:transketolase-like TK C-terminal-containing protein [Sphaerochaeta sp. PS]|uniref:transketolase-like TK C-terminal-containing protein n=1 Tax=Sphaerochaeta sp. PS TaxID=3076336 RepID=UPI0028A48077|nr:transketolase [Sphaerochaeta sp. PS]MDT4763093.1 transketolase [Sphaerochaeta sp. PS]